MEIADGKELGQLGFHPFLLFGTLALGAVSVPAGIIGNMNMFTTVTPVDMGTESISSATSDSKKGFILLR